MSFVAAFDKRIYYNEATHYAVLQCSATRFLRNSDNKNEKKARISKK